MNEEMTIQSLVKVLRKRWFFILMLMVLSIGVAFLISYFIQTPIYEAETQLLVNQKAMKISNL